MTDVPRRRCAADCGQPLTCWNTDAVGRHWHPDCLPPGTPMPLPMQGRIRELEAELSATMANLDQACEDGAAMQAERDRLGALAEARHRVIERMAREAAPVEAAIERLHNWVSATSHGAAAAEILQLLDQPARTPRRRATTVTNHTYEGAPGQPCQAEAFGETCGAAREQHEMVEWTTVDNPLTSTNTMDNPDGQTS